MSPRIAGAVAALALLVSCAPDPKAPVKVVVLVYDHAGRYQPQTVELTTPTDLVALGGPVARIVGGASFDLSAKGLAGVPADATLQQVLKAATKDEGSTVRVSYLERDGVLVPADFHSLNIATTYYNFERAFSFFQSVGGLAVESFGTPTVYYFPKLVEETDPEKDNAAFASLFFSFLILPFDQLQQVPLAINAGVIGHEYSHAVFNYRVFSKAALPFPYSEWNNGDFEASPGLNLLLSLDEGIADTFGTGITCSKDLATCDATFFGESLPLDHAQERCLEGPGCELHCLSQMARPPTDSRDSLADVLANKDATRFANLYKYQVGSVLAGALWRAASDRNVTAELTAGGARRAMFTTLYKALAGGADGSSGLRELVQAARTDQTRFRLDSSDGDQGVLDAIVASSVNATLKTALCRAFLDRFNLAASAIPSCAAQTAFTECLGAR
jgi:hypothetical protein